MDGIWCMDPTPLDHFKEKGINISMTFVSRGPRLAQRVGINNKNDGWKKREENQNKFGRAGCRAMRVHERGPSPCSFFISRFQILSPPWFTSLRPPSTNLSHFLLSTSPVPYLQRVHGCCGGITEREMREMPGSNFETQGGRKTQVQILMAAFLPPPTRRIAGISLKLKLNLPKIRKTSKKWRTLSPPPNPVFSLPFFKPDLPPAFSFRYSSFFPPPPWPIRRTLLDSSGPQCARGLTTPLPLSRSRLRSGRESSLASYATWTTHPLGLRNTRVDPNSEQERGSPPMHHTPSKKTRRSPLASWT